MKKGFGTLFIVIILGSLALALVLMLSTNSFLLIKSTTDTRRSYEAKALASACAEIALEVLRENNNYVGSGNVALSNQTCQYTIANSGGLNRILNISSTINGLTTNLEIMTTAFNPINISSWQEV